MAKHRYFQAQNGDVYKAATPWANGHVQLPAAEGKQLMDVQARELLRKVVYANMSGAFWCQLTRVASCRGVTSDGGRWFRIFMHNGKTEPQEITAIFARATGLRLSSAGEAFLGGGGYCAASHFEDLLYTVVPRECVRKLHVSGRVL